MIFSVPNLLRLPINRLKQKKNTLFLEFNSWKFHLEQNKNHVKVNVVILFKIINFTKNISNNMINEVMHKRLHICKKML